MYSMHIQAAQSQQGGRLRPRRRGVRRCVGRLRRRPSARGFSARRGGAVDDVGAQDVLGTGGDGAALVEEAVGPVPVDQRAAGRRRPLARHAFDRAVPPAVEDRFAAGERRAGRLQAAAADAAAAAAAAAAIAIEIDQDGGACPAHLCCA
jgi:hypothetical protein